MKSSKILQRFNMVLFWSSLALGSCWGLLSMIPTVNALTVQQQLRESKSTIFPAFKSKKSLNLDWISQPEYLAQNTRESPFDTTTIVKGGRRSGSDDIVATLKDSTEYSTFTSLLDLADLTETLKQSNLVVLAPTEKAWANLGANAGQLIQPENREKLMNYLKNYIVVGGISEAQYQQGLVQTMAGSTLQIQEPESNQQISINGVTIPLSQLIVTKNDGTIVPMDKLLFPIE